MRHILSNFHDSNLKTFDRSTDITEHITIDESADIIQHITIGYFQHPYMSCFFDYGNIKE